MTATFAVLLLLTLLPGGAAGRTSHRQVSSWSGDYTTGDFSQWQSLQALPGDATVLLDPFAETTPVARYVVHPGDDPINSTGERAEARASQAQTNGYAGSEGWFGWKTFFPSDFNPAPAPGWNIFTQWHETVSDGCAPNVLFQVDMSKTPPVIRFRVRGGALASGSCAPPYDRHWNVAPLQLDRWTSFVLHVRWSANPASGFVEAWVNGTRVVPRTYTATLYAGQGVYLKQGFYRAENPTLTSTVFHAQTRRGSSYAAVAPN